MNDTDTVTELQQIRLERDEAVKRRDRIRVERFALTIRIFELNLRETEILSKA